MTSQSTTSHSSIRFSISIFCSARLIVWFRRSHAPLPAGWYEVARTLSMRQIVQKFCTIADSKLAQWSISKRRGAPKSKTHCAIKLSATVCADCSGIDAARPNLVKRSIIVKMYLFARAVSRWEAVPPKTSIARISARSFLGIWFSFARCLLERLWNLSQDANLGLCPCFCCCSFRPVYFLEVCCRCFFFNSFDVIFWS